MSDKSLLRAISEDRALGSAMLFGHRHSNDSPDYAVKILDAWRAADPFVLIEAFRGAAKSTLSEEFLAMEGCYGNFHYCLLIGETYAKACQRLDAIAFECLTNHKIGKIFGSKVLARKPIENKIWFSSGALIEAVGWEQEIRGYKYHDRRPERAHLDDVENLERVRSREAVDQTVAKLMNELRPAMDPIGRKIRVTQTPLAPDCLVTRLRSNVDWVCISIPVCTGDVDDPKTVSNWPSRYPMDWIRRERDAYANIGRLRDFQQEYLLSVDTLDQKPFSEEMFKGIDMAPAAWLPRYVIYDPSRTANMATSDRTGKVVVSRMGSKIIVHESGGYFWKPDELRADLFAAAEKHKAAKVGIEKNSLDDYLMQPIRYEMARRGKVLQIEPLQAPQDRDKITFIMGLHPFLVAGDVLLVGGKLAHPQLVAEGSNFPAGRLDILNALAYSFKMFSGSPVYEDFGAENVAPAHTPATGETVYLAWNANSAQTVCAVLLRQGRHLVVARDWAGSGPVADAVKSIATEIRASYPRGTFESYAPAELHDQWQRVPLVPALRSSGFRAFRGENIAVARGALADRIRSTVRERRCLTVDARATLTMNALAGGYKYPVAANGRQYAEPEPGVSRLVAEAVEVLTAALERGTNSAEPEGAHYGLNADGVKYLTSLPRRA